MLSTFSTTSFNILFTVIFKFLSSNPNICTISGFPSMGDSSLVQGLNFLSSLRVSYFFGLWYASYFVKRAVKTGIKTTYSQKRAHLFCQASGMCVHVAGAVVGGRVLPQSNL